MAFVIANEEFVVKEARLEPFDDEEGVICWGVSIIGARSERLPRVQPSIQFDRLLTTKPGELSHWWELAGRKVSWSKPDEGPEGLFEVWEGEEIHDCAWEFVARGDRGLGVKVRGITDILYDEPFNRDVPFRVDVALAIARWPMGGCSETASMERYRKTGLTDRVKYVQDDGVSFLVFQELEPA